MIPVVLFAAAMAAAALTGRERYPGPGQPLPEEAAALPRPAFWMPAVWFGVPIVGFIFLPIGAWALVIVAVAAVSSLAPPYPLGDRLRAAEIAAGALSALFLLSVILTAGPT